MKRFTTLLLALSLLLGSFIITASAASTSNFDWDDISSNNAVSLYADAKIKTFTSKKLTSKSGSIYKGDLVKIINVYDDSVARVEYPVSGGKKKAYVPLEALFESDSKKWEVCLASAKIKVYRADDLKKSFGSIYANDQFWIIDTSSGVSQVLYPVSSGYKLGFVSVKTLNSSIKGSDTSSSSGQILYDVAHYTQKNKAWRDLVLNSNADIKRTIGSHGCTTVAAAMLMSYYLQDEITPADIQKTSSYTSDNLLVWNSLPVNVSLKTYNKTMNSSIRHDLVELLEDGPVIVGASKSSGSNQHWIIVIGFTGDPSSPRNSDFIVLDPAQNEATTLNDFLQNNRTYIKRFVYVK